ncbi:hypothetical protein B9Z19DRAFT_1124803 [Tuber borchii]|uniref:alcohol dehydrogenase n=1 Tax=Tuber borchii TaxID=42251 RepID=A0A2T6ZW59_TUBBO|nr:hypothetical protein B9Z19DRAFT_1124803 [Tuber borchii]
MSIPRERYAQIFKSNNDPIDYKKVPAPKSAPDKVLINIKYTGVCHTDLHVKAPASLQQWEVISNEVNISHCLQDASVVVAMGELVEEIGVGDHAGIKWLNGSCGRSEFCKDEPLCEKALLSGYTMDDTFQQYAIGKAAHVALILKGAPLDAISPLLCAGITICQTITIVGAGGGPGSLAVQYAKDIGFRVMAINTGSEMQGVFLNTLGAEELVDFAKGDVVANVKSVAGGLGAHAATLLAVSEKPSQQAAESCRARGTIVCVGLPPKVRVPAEVFSTVIRMITIKGSYVGNRLDTQEAIDFFARCLIKAPFKVRMLSELTQVFQLLEECKIAGRYVLNTSVSSINHILGRFSDLTSPLI